jgi:hypothetical protein
MYRRRACTQVLFLRKSELGFFHCLEIVQAGWYLPLVRRSQYNLAPTFHRRRSRFGKRGWFFSVQFEMGFFMMHTEYVVKL